MYRKKHHKNPQTTHKHIQTHTQNTLKSGKLDAARAINKPQHTTNQSGEEVIGQTKTTRSTPSEIRLETD